MTVKVFINGTVCDEGQASISVFDRGFLYGDSVYEVLRTSGGNPVDLDRHLARLVRSAESIALQVPLEDQFRDAVARTLHAAGNAESYVRVIVTRGGGDISLDTALAGAPTSIVIVRPLSLPSPAQYERGVGLQIVTVQRTSRHAVDPSVKSGNYLNNILALAEARRAGAYEALMCDARGRIAEGSTSNVFVVRDGTIHTPALEIGLLAGITRQRVIEMAQAAGIQVREGTLLPDDVRDAAEVFITSSIRGVLPIAAVDGEGLANVPGPVTRQTMQRYDSFLAEVARS